MTDTALHADQTSHAQPAHPLDPATAAEYLAGREAMAAAGLLAGPTRFAYYGLEEPHKHDVLAGDPGTAERRLRAFLINLDTGASTDVVVSLTDQRVVSARRLATRTDGQLPIVDSDFARVDEIVKADPDWRAAMARRGRARSRRARSDHPTTTGGGWSACSRSSRPRNTTWPGRTPSTASPPTWT
jgi:primary-amine oxidase